MPEKEKIKGMFDSISNDYDRLNHIMSLDVDRLWRKRAISRIVDTDMPLEVLDVASGTGDFAIAIAKAMRGRIAADTSDRALSLDAADTSNRVKPLDAADTSDRVKPLNAADTSDRVLSFRADEVGVGICDKRMGHITAVDISEGMLSVMRQKVASEALDNVISVEVGDGENLRFPDGTFDRVAIAFGIRNFENKEKGLREMLRVLKPGGKLVLLELSLPENKWLRHIFNLYFLNILPIIGGSVSGDSAAYKYLPASVLGFPKKKEFIALMKSCGFTHVRHKSFTFGVCRMFIGEHPVSKG
jgi:hypothetical protein